MEIALTRLLVFLIIIVGLAGKSGDNWVLEKDKDNIKIWTRETKNSNIKSFKAIAICDASVAQLTAILNDVPAYPQWMSNIEMAEVIKKVSNHERYYYFIVDAPWPVSNRDNVVHFMLDRDPETNVVTINVSGVPDYVAENEGIVRIPKSVGIWKFTPKTEGKTEILFEYSADPGGKLPAWAINMFIVDGPFKTLSKLKEFVKRDKYH